MTPGGRAALAALVLLGCSGDPPPRAAEPAKAPPAATGAAGSTAPDRGGSPAPDEGASVIPGASRQLVLVAVDSWSAVDAEVARFERSAPGWSAVGEPWPAVIGARGAGWGRGLHGDGAPDGRGGPVKVEGDGKSPAGVFAIGAAYGYGDAAPAGARVPYTKVDASWRCVDDTGSAHYNRVLDADGVEVDWSSAEEMRRADELYRWVLLVDHNTARAPGAGSCIFLHVWSGAGRGTAGCTAMARDHMEELLGWLDPAARPVLVLLPREELAALREPWALPPQRR